MNIKWESETFSKTCQDHLQSPQFRGKQQHLEAVEQPHTFSLRVVCHGLKHQPSPAPLHLSHPSLQLSESRPQFPGRHKALVGELYLQGTRSSWVGDSCLRGTRSSRGLPALNSLSSWLAPLYPGNSRSRLFLLAFKCHLNNTPALVYIYMQAYLPRLSD